MNMTECAITFCLSRQQKTAFKEYAKRNGMNISKALRFIIRLKTINFNNNGYRNKRFLHRI